MFIGENDVQCVALFPKMFQNQERSYMDLLPLKERRTLSHSPLFMGLLLFHSLMFMALLLLIVA